MDRKYGILVLQDVGQRALQAFIAKDAVHAFIIAKDFEVERLQDLAARCTLRLPLYELFLFPLSFRRNHQILVRYHLRCGAAARRAILFPNSLCPVGKLVFGMVPSSGYCHTCIVPYPDWLDEMPDTPRWWGRTELWKIMEVLAKSLQMHPSVDRLVLPKDKLTTRCQRCHDEVLADLPLLWRSLLASAMSAIQGVSHMDEDKDEGEDQDQDQDPFRMLFAASLVSSPERYSHTIDSLSGEDTCAPDDDANMDDGSNASTFDESTDRSRAVGMNGWW
ncbi:hypothetical protein OF83DRAFT_1179755 [Amylostereum chailletii]|nr:hypothetical protein OF83DRAFT_1179755 [Amylostereum chailletii]